MRESIGGALTLEIVIIFMVLVNSYLAYSVNYSKAFKVKNSIIDLIENNEGYPSGTAVSCTANNTDDSFAGKLCAILNSYGYNAKGYPAKDKGCSDVPHAPGLDDLGICIIPHTNIIGQESVDNKYQGVYYTVYSYINIDLPIIRNIFENMMPSVFRISGDTNIIYSSGGDVFLGTNP